MSNFLEAYGNDPVVMESLGIVNEGWGMVIAQFFPILGPALKQLSAQGALDKLIRYPKFVKYITKHCDEVLKREKKQDKTIGVKFKPYDFNEFIKAFNAEHETGFWTRFKREFTGADAFTKFGNYFVWFQMDTEKIYGAYLFLYSEDKDKYSYHNLPAPSKEDLEKMME